MYIMVNDQILATEEIRCIRPTGNRIEFWEHGWWTQPQCLYCRNVSDAHYLYGRLCYRYSQELSTGQKVLVNLQVH